MFTANGSDLYALLQITALVLMPAVVGRSMARALYLAPSSFSHVALSTYFRRQRLTDALWLAFAIAWFGYTVMQPGSAAPLTQVAISVLLAGSIGSFLWMHGILRPELARAVSNGVGSATAVAPVNTAGDFERRHNMVDPALAIDAARRMAVIHGTLGTFAMLIVLAIAAQTHAFPDPGELLAMTVVTGLWLSLRVLVMDLAMDTWPGAGSEARLRRAFVYYVQMFEQWVVRGVLVSIMIVMVLAPVAALLGYVPLITASFAVCAILYMVVATVWNKFYAAERVTSPLALPMQANRYSARHGVWAYAVTIMHFGMLCCLVAGIAAVNGLLV